MTDRRGVTLIELLIAITLVSALTLGIMFAMRIGLQTMERSNEHFMTTRRVLGVERVMYAQLAGFMPVKGECRFDPAAPGKLVPFFEGMPQTMRFVSSYSLQDASRGLPRILEFAVVPGEQGAGVRLVVNELVYSGPQSTAYACVGMMPEAKGTVARFRPPQIGEGTFVLADRLERCIFLYKESLKEPPFERWVPEWKSEMYPTAVRIDLAPLDRDSTKLQVLPVTIPFHVDREPMLVYDN